MPVVFQQYALKYVYQKSVFKEVKFKKKYSICLASILQRSKHIITSGIPSADDIIKSTALPSCQQQNFAENELHSQLINESS